MHHPQVLAGAVVSKARTLKGKRDKVDLAENLAKRALTTLLKE